MYITEKQIDDLRLQIPELPKRPRKNLYDILGVQNKETINSKVLAYFLDPNEDHEFGTLFFDSLLQILITKQEKNCNLKVYAGTYEVSIEDTTYYAESIDQKQKRIDITLTGKDWCIIIENKLYHNLQNPLKAYWQHAKENSSNVMGVVLSLDEKSVSECTDGDIRFINVIHKEWINQIQSNLVLNDIDSDTDIFYLREYIKSIKKHYQDKMEEPERNKLVNTLIEKKEIIAKIEKDKVTAIKHIDEQIESVLKDKFEKKNLLYKHRNIPGLCLIFIPSKRILEENYIAFGYEVHDELKEELGDKISIIHKLLKQGLAGANYNLVSNNKETDNEEGKRLIKECKNLNFYFDDKYNTPYMSRLITYRKNDFLSKNTDVKKELNKILDKYFFNEGGIEQTVLSLMPETVKMKPAKEIIT